MRIKDADLCISCMKPLEGQPVCRHCGFVQQEYHAAGRCLPAGTVLKNRYVLGRVLGQGSFGITYIAWDALLEIRVAIKEYFPTDLVGRYIKEQKDTKVYVYEQEELEHYKESLEKYLEEAKSLSRFSELEGIVSIRDFFYENQTAYIIMSYIDGISLKEYVEKNGAIPAHGLLAGLKPLIKSLEQIHEEGMLHRDISPDNILVTSHGKMQLIDFGASRKDNPNKTHTMTVVFKRGYSPEEQYRPRGKQGAWTDIYALCATMYFALTGKPPLESIERMVDDDIRSLVDLPDVELNDRQKKAIMKGMAVKPEKRYQSISELYEILYAEETDTLLRQGKEEGFLPWGKGKLAFGLFLFLLVIFGVFWGYQKLSGREDIKGHTNGAVNVSPEVTAYLQTETPSAKGTEASETEPAPEPTKQVKATKKPKTTKESKATKKPKATRKPTPEPTKEPTPKPTRRPVRTKAPKATKKPEENFDALLP